MILAEVASVHQILSLLGHKVKVPAAARQRMYQLVKGRDSTRTTKPAKSRADQPEPVTKPINPWVVPEAPRRSKLERLGPAVACLCLIGLCGTAAWMSLTAQPPEGVRTLPPGEALGERCVGWPEGKYGRRCGRAEGFVNRGRRRDARRRSVAGGAASRGRRRYGAA